MHHRAHLLPWTRLPAQNLSSTSLDSSVGAIQLRHEVMIGFFLETHSRFTTRSGCRIDTHNKFDKTNGNSSKATLHLSAHQVSRQEESKWIKSRSSSLRGSWSVIILIYIAHSLEAYERHIAKECERRLMSQLTTRLMICFSHRSSH